MEYLAGLVAAVAAALENSGLGAAMRGARGYYPAANVAHVGGLILLVGSIGVLDLRVAGLGRRVPLAALSRFLTPFAVVGLALLAVSGFLLFSADAGPMIRSPVFRAKMLLALIAVLNAAWFRYRFGDMDWHTEPPTLARLMAVGSLAVWLTVACLGRLIAYT